jgi:hypothetical protein
MIESRSPIRAAYRLIGDIDATLGAPILNIAIAQGEPEIQSDAVLADHGRKAVAGVRQAAHTDFYPAGEPQAIPLT